MLTLKSKTDPGTHDFNQQSVYCIVSLNMIHAFYKGALSVTGASKILARPERGWGSDPCQDFLVDLIKCTKANGASVAVLY